VLDALGVSSRAKIRTQYAGATTDNAGALQALRDYAKRTPYGDLSARVEEYLRGIDRAPEEPLALPEEGEQLTLPGIPEGGPRERRPEDRPEDAAPEDELAAIRNGVASGQQELSFRYRGAGVPSDRRKRAAAPTAEPAGTGMGVSVPSARAPDVGAGAQPRPLEGQGELFPGADLGTAPARPAEPEAGVEQGPSPQQQLFDTAGQPIVPPAPPCGAHSRIYYPSG